MTTEPLRLAVIGAGKHARALLIPALHLTPGLQLVALATGRAETAAAVQAQFGLPTDAGYEALLQRADIEAVLISSPTSTHADMTVAALRAGKHVYCETPGVTTPEEIARVSRAQAENGRVLTYGTHLRYAPVYRMLGTLLPEVRAGGSVVLSVRFYSWVRHMYDLTLLLLGDVAAVTARRQGTQTVVIAETAGGDLAIVHSGGPANPAIPLEYVQLTGAGGVVVVRDGHELSVFREAAAVGAHDLAFASAPATVWSPTASIPYEGLVGYTLRGYIPALETFVRAVRTGAPTLSGIDQAARTLRLERAVARAVAEGGMVTVEPPWS
jgi:predicted dehydrogenase